MALTPMMQQYLQIHEQAPDAILLFRLGDFYEMFFDDAITASKTLSLVLTGRDCGLEERAPMCGVPYHAADTYIAKLVKAGHKVAVCEQVEDPATTKGLVKREIIKIISPGTVTDEKLLDEKANNYLMCIYATAIAYGIAYIDISTAEFKTCLIDGAKRGQLLLNEVAKIQPKEIICNTTFFESQIKEELSSRFEIYIDVLEPHFFSKKHTAEAIKKYFDVYTLDALGLESDDTIYSIAIGATLLYLDRTQRRTLTYIKNIVRYTLDETIPLDLTSRRNLEITSTMRANQKKGSLLWVLDKTQTAMGARKLRDWLENPLRSLERIDERLDGVEEIRGDLILMDDVRYALGEMYDIQRIATRICAENCSPKDMLMLKSSVVNLIQLKRLLAFTKSACLDRLSGEIDELSDIAELVERAIDENAPTQIKDGGMIREGYDEEVDNFKAMMGGSRRIMDELEMRERQATGIKTLKIKYNKVFGYYIEVSNSQKNLVPEHYIRKQTLVNAERFYTEELKQIEIELLSASERLKAREGKVYEDVRLQIVQNVHRILSTADAVAAIDALAAFAYAAYLNNYVKPMMNQGGELILTDARHPVVEKMLDGDFIANDCHMNGSDKRMSIITGPNMAGKSTYIRQIALITLMAQCGSFVPAAEAHIPLVDRIFTRVGASDDIVTGKSTFMVEMSEMANILKNATPYSLIILDEIGRGTSTFDGLSIAWATAEYISEKTTLGAKTLFATHYHELTELEESLDGVVNLCIKVKETPDGVVFLRKIEKGAADKSYGIEVARLAGLPDSVIRRARDILHILEEKESIKKEKIESLLDGTQIAFSLPQADIETLSQSEAEAIDDLKSLDVNALTPLEAMVYLNELKQRLT